MSGLVDRIETLVVSTPDFLRLEGLLAVFCPFEAIGMVDQEIRHAHWLAYLLDPHRLHGFGDAFLRSTLLLAAEAYRDEDLGTDLRPIDVHLLDLDDVEIIRERDRIDLRLILAPDGRRFAKGAVFAFELKVRAREAGNQLTRYADMLRSRYPDHARFHFFLTLDGDRPSQAAYEHWVPLAFDDLISRFEALNARSIGTDEARALVGAYTRMMRRRHMPDDTSELRLLARRLWQDHAEALDYLASQRPDEKRELLDLLLERGDAIVAALNAQTGERAAFALDPGRRGRGTFFLGLEEWTGHPMIGTANDGGPLLGFNVTARAGDRLRIAWFAFPGDPVRRKRLLDAVAEAKLFGNRRGRRGELWTTIDYTEVTLSRNDLTALETGIPALITEALQRFAGGRRAAFAEVLQALESAAAR